MDTIKGNNNRETKKLKYIDPMNEVVVGTAPKAVDAPYLLYFEYDPVYGNYTKRVPWPVVSKDYGTEQLKLEKSSEKFYGGRTKPKSPLERDLRDEIDWGYN